MFVVEELSQLVQGVAICELRIGARGARGCNDWAMLISVMSRIEGSICTGFAYCCLSHSTSQDQPLDAVLVDRRQFDVIEKPCSGDYCDTSMLRRVVLSGAFGG